MVSPGVLPRFINGTNPGEVHGYTAKCAVDFRVAHFEVKRYLQAGKLRPLARVWLQENNGASLTKPGEPVKVSMQWFDLFQVKYAWCRRH